MTATGGYHCTRCGADADYVGPSLDPDHPLVRCRRGRKGDGVVPGSRSLPELERVLRANGWQRVVNRHVFHMGPHGSLVMACPLCRDVYDQGLAARHA